jgi:hypothetical protein
MCTGKEERTVNVSGSWAVAHKLALNKRSRRSIQALPLVFEAEHPERVVREGLAEGIKRGNECSDLKMTSGGEMDW